MSWGVHIYRRYTDGQKWTCFSKRERERRKGGEDFEETMAAQRKYFMTQRGMDRDARDWDERIVGLVADFF